VNLRLPAVLMRVRSNFDLKKERVNDVSVLVASSSEERYTFFVDDNFLPQKLVHERLIAPRGTAEIEFAQYREVQAGLRLPHVTVLRYPDRPKHEQVFEYTKIDPGLSLRDSYFSRP